MPGNLTPSSSSAGLPQRSSIQQSPPKSAPLARPLNDQAILEYLSRRGFSKAEYVLRAELANAGSNPSSVSTGGKGKTVGLEEFADKNANSPSDGSNAGLGRKKGGVGRGLIKQPSEYAKGYEGLREFVYNSLDFYRPAFTPFLLPLFVHSYLDLVLDGRRDAADDFLHRFSADHRISEPYLIQHLATLRHPYHIQESEVAQRWRRERYVIRISERAKNLLMTWLQIESLGGDVDESRAKDRMTSTINEKVRVEYTPTSLLSQFPCGLESDFYQQQQEHATNTSPLKLGSAPKDPKLMREVSKVLANEEAPPKSVESGDPHDGDNADVPMTDGTKANLNPTNPPATPNLAVEALSNSDLVPPTASDLPPYPNNFKTLDIRREAEFIREAKKRIKLGPDAFGNKQAEKKVWKPSVCAFTIHDAGNTMTAARFSEDVTILGAGFSDSYIKLWNLKGDPFEPIRDSSAADTLYAGSNESEMIPKMRKKTATNSIKLIGHSGPVYSLSFDPVPGPAAPPRHLLSSSQDSTIRLWSLDLFKNLVVYRGHREPVWDVEWGPQGIYFASASRDRTARLWCSERVGAVRMFVGHLSDVDCVRFHPNSLYLATGSSDRTCRVWDVQVGNSVRVFHGHEGAVNCIAISPDGKLLASAGEDQSIKLWDIGSSRLIKTMRGHQSTIYSLAFSAESTILASAGADCSVRIWDAQSMGTDPQVVPNPLLQKDNSNPNPEDDASVTQLPELKLKGDPKTNIKLLRRGLFGLHEYRDTPDLLLTLPTRQTPILNVNFTTRNLLLGVGPMTLPPATAS